MSQKLITILGAFVAETAKAINDNFTELFARPSGGAPGGADTQVQFNDAGTFGGATGFAFTKSNGSITFPGDIALPASDPFAILTVGGNPNHPTHAFFGLDVDVSSQFDGATATNVAVTLVRTAATTNTATALQTTVYNDSFASAGIIPGMRGLWVNTNEEQAFGSTTNEGVFIDAQQGQSTNNYALHIADQGTGANDYAIKVEGGRSVFGGPVITATHTPSSATDTGIAGQFAWDASFIYICTATDTWKRVAIATW